MTTAISEEHARQLLQKLSFPVYKSGYRRLCMALPFFAEDPEQSLVKELYPRIARETGCSIGSIEASIRRAIQTAWERGDRAVWQTYFPGITKAPTNQVFIATMAEYIS